VHLKKFNFFNFLLYNRIGSCLYLKQDDQQIIKVMREKSLYNSMYAPGNKNIANTLNSKP